VRRTARRLGGVLVAAALVAGLGGCGHVAQPPDSLGSAFDQAMPASIASIPLTKSDGTTTTLGAYRGKTVMIADFLTLCTDICPLISANSAALARALRSDGETANTAVLEITVDPKRDTPTRLAAYEKLFPDVPRNWTLLTASKSDIGAIWKYYGVDYGREKEPKHPSIDWLTHKPLTYDVFHSDDLIFLDSAGHERYVVNSDPNATGENVPASLVKLLNSEGLVSLNKPDPIATWTVPQGLSVFSWLLDKKLAAPA
jgi:protein SCO1/2